MGWAFGQTAADGPRFEIADVHISPKTTNRMMGFSRGGPARGGRYQATSSTMVDLIARAYSFANNKVLDGPSWLELDTFDIAAKLPADSTPADQRLMLQALLEERFKLKVHKENRPLPTFALVVGKKHLMKPADGEGETGCKLDSGGSGGPPGEGGMILNSMGADGKATTIRLGPGMVLEYHCRNMSMAAFTEGLRGMMGTNPSIGDNPLLNETGLEGRWNFDVRWSLGLMGPMMANGGEHISLSDALEKQLGLKLEPRQVSTPVLVVDSVNRTPTDNPSGVADALPPIPIPTEFEVADVKPAGPGRMGGFRMQPGGRLTAMGIPMRLILIRAFNSFNNDELLNVPSWADTERFDITAKAPATDPAAPPLDILSVAPLLKSLLAERFGLKYHEELRALPAYTLVAAKPKMKKADPESRSWCKQMPAPAGAPPGSQMLSCQNSTMAEFAERLQGLSSELNWPVLDATGLQGGWDLTLTYSRNFGAMPIGPGRGSADDVASASDPSGAITVFQALEKQLGLKLELQKRPEPVFVIDHLNQKPTDN